MRDRFNERYIAAIKADCMHECCLESGFVKLSKADTFIEYCFEMACAHMNRGLDVLTEWRYRKDQYCKIEQRGFMAFTGICVFPRHRNGIDRKRIT